MRMLAVVLLLLSGAVAQAQDPRVTVELSATETVVGQPLNLVVTILVPTWMPKSPVYPTFEIPSLMVRLPEKSTIAISESIDGDTWAGVRRTYRLYPLAAELFRIPPQNFTLTYADPETRAPIEVTVASPEVVLEAVVPEAARNLDPLIVADGFALEQEIDGTETLSPGDAVVRTVRASIDGTTVVMIPSLVPVTETPGLRAYPAEAVITEQENRGTISGTREEKVTYLAQTNGEATLPAISLDWYNIATGKVETADVPAFALTVHGAAEDAETGLSRDHVLRIGLGSVGVLLGVLFVRRFRPLIDAWIASQRARWRASEPYARRAVQQAIRAQDLSRTYTALEVWATRLNVPRTAMVPLFDALAEVGQNRYGVQGQTRSNRSAWRKVESQFVKLRENKRLISQFDQTDQMAPLNPF